jgi:hypothetical protein
VIPNSSSSDPKPQTLHQEKEGGKKKNKLSPLKKLILKDRAVTPHP